jgi:hypothetical protein
MSDVEREQPGHDDGPTTPSGEPEPSDDERDPQGDPVTGSTEEDPSVEDTGLPPAGRDPMAGESPSS